MSDTAERQRVASSQDVLIGGMVPLRPDRALIMGVLNVTPDSFSDGGLFDAPAVAVKHAKQLAAEGADIIDVGGESTRPGASEISAEEEADRVVPVIEALASEIDIPISVDTYKASTAEAALKAGARVINDVWGLKRDRNLMQVAADHHAPVIIGHWDPDLANEADDMRVMPRMVHHLRGSVEDALAANIPPEHITLDPGIGFGKTPAQNLVILNNLHALHEMGFPLLIGTSRKRFIGEITRREPMDRLAGTIGSNLMAVANGAQMIRVHDVAAHHDALRVAHAIETTTMPND